ncbi:MAG TPA: phosphatase PAP2 family protein [Sphingomonas sp.]|nr:phosphatase PAP2 family protein [Sphingomonas sp.]
MSKVKTAAKRLERADRKVTHKAAAKHDTPAMRVAATVGELADQPPLIALSAATLVLGLVLRRRSVAEAGARMLASHLLATAAKEVVKRSVDRTRPHSVKKGHSYKLEPGGDRSHHYSSFPSGHTAGAVAVARAAARVWPDRTPALSLAAAGAGAIQLPIAKHYVGDVLAGAAIGLASEWVVDAVVQAAAGGPE